jgi:hypothetical protein
VGTPDQLSRFRPLGPAGKRSPAWLLDLRDRSGAYVIRDRRSLAPLYVGSSRCQLKKTILRHFQQWQRSKTFWEHLFGSDSRQDPGVTFDRARTEVAVFVTVPSRAHRAEQSLINRFLPRSNVNAAPDNTPF